MTYLVFTKSEEGFVDTAKLVRHAERFFGATLAVAKRVAATKDTPERLTIAIRCSSVRTSHIDSAFTLTVRKVTKQDHRAALDAEARGQVPGMAALAQQCQYVWEVSEYDEADPKPTWLLCAVLASVALGPVLPPDQNTLLGVRGARDLANSPAAPYRH